MAERWDIYKNRIDNKTCGYIEVDSDLNIEAEVDKSNDSYPAFRRALHKVRTGRVDFRPKNEPVEIIDGRSVNGVVPEDYEPTPYRLVETLRGQFIEEGGDELELFIEKKDPPEA